MVTLRSLFEDLAAGELGLLVTFLVVGTYMFVEAANYGDIVGLYPRLLSAVVVLCTLALLFRNLLPEPVRNYVAGSGGVLDSSTEVADELDSDDIERAAGAEPETEGSSRRKVVLTVVIGGYLLLSYLVGMYFATPVFGIVYGIVYDLGWKMTLLVTAAVFAAAHLFLTVFDAPIASGLLL